MAPGPADGRDHTLTAKQAYKVKTGPRDLPATADLDRPGLHPARQKGGRANRLAGGQRVGKPPGPPRSPARRKMRSWPAVRRAARRPS